MAMRAWVGSLAADGARLRLHNVETVGEGLFALGIGIKPCRPARRMRKEAGESAADMPPGLWYWGSTAAEPAAAAPTAAAVAATPASAAPPATAPFASLESRWPPWRAGCGVENPSPFRGVAAAPRWGVWGMPAVAAAGGSPSWWSTAAAAAASSSEDRLSERSGGEASSCSGGGCCCTACANGMHCCDCSFGS